ncbi:MAG: SDR family NAD(P)-dependent oxidoreductase [Jaaginema sp. PMC 1079.18]|nr:SDR family NAD(P)-dependent oxidoreductase [Jaaginema sp. PMC 1080.18]MEC4853321.1 SDR family NAD(P)-dependent oxidoreductase [Jaaginema sp. PMC 1079.18]MEC4866737.1 SDR family NAD(P)-dependent oxidoreductase [Jaaginema sp. PMC 1078.18]
MKLQGKVALVTGASRGIGRAIALELARCGVKRLFLVARDRAQLAAVAQLVRELGVEAIPLAIDLTEATAIQIAIAQAWRDQGPIHLLVNCAGVAHQTPFLQSKLPQVQDEVALNFMGMYAITRAVARRMATRQEGTIVNVSSLMGKIAAPTMSTYSATKFAILGFTQALRGELANHNIKVVALLPTLTNTDMTRHIERFPGIFPISPETVAQSLIKGLEKGSSEILVGWQSHLAVWCQRLAPGLMNWILRQLAPKGIGKRWVSREC